MGFMKQHQAKLAQGNASGAKQKAVMGISSQALNGLGKNTEMARFHAMATKDYAALKVIKSHEQRNKQKAEIIPNYMPYIEAYLAGKERYKNPVLVIIMIWAFDCGDIGLAMKLAQEAMKANDELPQIKDVVAFKSNLQDFILDSVFDYLEGEQKQGRTVEPYLSTAFEWLESIETFDQVKAKFHKLAGLHAFELEDWKATIEHFETAEKLDSKIQVTTKLKEAKKKLNKQTGGNA